MIIFICELPGNTVKLLHYSFAVKQQLLQSSWASWALYPELPAGGALDQADTLGELDPFHSEPGLQSQRPHSCLSAETVYPSSWGGFHTGNDEHFPIALH